MSRPQYTDEFRTEAVVLLEAAGYPDTPGALSHVARQLGIPHQTLSRWARGVQNPPPHQLVQVKKLDLVEVIRDEIQAAFAAMPGARGEAGYKDLTTAAAILIDKLQLLTGGPTERTEHQIQTATAMLDLPDHERLQ